VILAEAAQGEAMCKKSGRKGRKIDKERMEALSPAATR
jgi:hypothetical protein